MRTSIPATNGCVERPGRRNATMTIDFALVADRNHAKRNIRI